MSRPALKDTVFHVETRRDAILALANGASAAVHDHRANPLIYKAASELIARDDRGISTDIKAFGFPHLVLQDIAFELKSLGVSTFTSGQILEALESYTVGLGADFAREAQAKPLYARVIVTDRKPEDIPDCELVQATLIDGQRQVGEGVSQRVMQSTIYGTRTSMTKEVNLDEMLAAGKKKWLLIYFGSPANEAGDRMTAVDLSLINLAQGLGTYIPQQINEQITTMIRTESLDPAALEILSDFTKIKNILEPVEAHQNLASAEKAELADLVLKIKETVISINEDAPVPLPDVFIEACNLALSHITQDTGIPFHQLHQILPESLPEFFQKGDAENDAVYHRITLDDYLVSIERLIQSPEIPSSIRQGMELILGDVAENPEANIAQLTRALAGIASLPSIPPKLFAAASRLLDVGMMLKSIPDHGSKIYPVAPETQAKFVTQRDQILSKSSVGQFVRTVESLIQSESLPVDVRSNLEVQLRELAANPSANIANMTAALASITAITSNTIPFATREAIQQSMTLSQSIRTLVDLGVNIRPGLVPSSPAQTSPTNGIDSIHMTAEVGKIVAALQVAEKGGQPLPPEIKKWLDASKETITSLQGKTPSEIRSILQQTNGTNPVIQQAVLSLQSSIIALQQPDIQRAIKSLDLPAQVRDSVRMIEATTVADTPRPVSQAVATLLSAPPVQGGADHEMTRLRLLEQIQQVPPSTTIQEFLNIPVVQENKEALITLIRQIDPNVIKTLPPEQVQILQEIKTYVSPPTKQEEIFAPPTPPIENHWKDAIQPAQPPAPSTLPPPQPTNIPPEPVIDEHHPIVPPDPEPHREPEPKPINPVPVPEPEPNTVNPTGPEIIPDGGPPTPSPEDDKKFRDFMEQILPEPLPPEDESDVISCPMGNLKCCCKAAFTKVVEQQSDNNSSGSIIASADSLDALLELELK